MRQRTISFAIMRVLVLMFLTSVWSHAQFSKARLSPTGDSEIPSYDLTIHVLPERHELEVSGEIRIPPKKEAVPEIRVYLSHLMRNFQVDVLEPKDKIGTVTPVKLDTSNNSDQWAIRPNQPFPAQAWIVLHFSYNGGEGTAYTYYLGPEGSFAGQGSLWYPRFGPATGHLKFVVPAGYVVLATGTPASSPDQEARGNYEFECRLPGRFAFTAAKYTVWSAETGSVPTKLYLMRPRPDAVQFVNQLQRALNVLINEFGSYPYPQFAIAEVPSDHAQQASFSGAGMNGFMMVSSAALDAGFRLAFYAHEMSHQWWTNEITHTGKNGAYMLDEALAQFGSLRAVEELEGDEAAAHYRRNGYPGYGTANSGYGYFLSSDANDHALWDLPDDIGHMESPTARGSSFGTCCLGQLDARDSDKRCTQSRGNTHFVACNGMNFSELYSNSRRSS
jgi:hypothetical protein